METHVSDFSGCHYRLYVIKCTGLGEKADVRKNAYKEELENNRDLINTYEGHEALWYYR